MKILTVKPLFQNDNEYWGGAPGSVQCCPTSNAMLLAYLKPELLDKSQKLGFVEFESYYKSEFEKTGYSSNNRGNHEAHTTCLKERFGVNSTWRTDLQPEDLRVSIDADIPVVLGLEYKSSGHILLLIGYSDEGWYVNDPYGIRRGSQDVYDVINDGRGTAGIKDFYRNETAETTIFSGGSAWGRIVTR